MVPQNRKFEDKLLIGFSLLFSIFIGKSERLLQNNTTLSLLSGAMLYHENKTEIRVCVFHQSAMF